ncbi:nestin [Gouania willdenowi]|uniref:nestin n=1 Tax=Gouania willdenowi TaxID=441366 RepID=UPI0010561B33|nr:nestin [Gouania willdenowi]
MELHRIHKTSNLNMDDEKHQMLNLNRRLETYLSRVKHLEEENELLAKEIQGMRYNNQGAQVHRMSMEEELRQTRQAVDEAWRDRVLAEFEVNKMVEELESLDLQRQREAEARMRAKTKLEQSRKELEEEQRAQIWLRQKVSQLEQEINILIQNHHEDVAHLETQLTQSKVRMPQRVQQTPNLLQLGQEYSQRATRAWQEAAEAYQFQLARMEESLDQARGRLSQVNQEKEEIQLKLKALEKEIVSEHEVRQHLERTGAQRRDQHGLGIQQLEEHLQGLEAEKEQLGQQIDELVLENQGLLKLKMSLGLEVTTYRALLDRGHVREGISFVNQPRYIPFKEGALSPLGVKKNHQAKKSASIKTTSFSPLQYTTKPTMKIAAPLLSKRSAVDNEPPNIPRKPANTTDLATQDTSYPKILEAGAVESFRPQEVHEKVTYAEPLSHPQEEEEQKGEGKPLEIKPAVESVVSNQIKFDLTKEPYFTEDVANPQLTTFTIKPYQVKMTEELFGISDESNKDISKETDELFPLTPLDAQVKEKYIKDVQEESSDSETEALLEPTCGSSKSSPEFECEPEEVITENLMKESAAEVRQERSGSVEGTRNGDDKLYPDGEEMDTWDSVIERKIDLEADDSMKTIEGNTQHAEPEEDISAQECRRNDCKQSFATNEQADSVEKHNEKVSDAEEMHDSHSDNDQEDEEDSQNVSVSWRTELESDSYAQDNTLADNRPLIQYKSDETDMQMQASQAEESESSEGEQDRKVGATWGEEKSKGFGTMEDLCEEVEGEMLDEEYDTEYIYPEGMDEENSTVVSEDFIQDFVVETQEVSINEEQADEENKLKKPTQGDCDEQLEIDRLVELELENLTTDSYSTHFADHQTHPKMLPLMEKKQPELEKPGGSNTEDNSEQNEPILLAHSAENLLFRDPSEVIHQAATVLNDDISHDGQQFEAKTDVMTEHSLTMVTEKYETKDQFGVSDISGSGTEEVKFSEDPQTLLQRTADQEIPHFLETGPVPVDTYNMAQENQIKEVADCQQISGSLQPPQFEKEVSKESEEDLVKDVEEYEQVACHLQPPKPFVDGSNELQEHLTENAAENQHPPQLIMHESEESQGHLKENICKNDEISGTLQQPKSISEASHHQIEDVANFQQPFSSPKPPQPFMDAWEPSQELPVHDAEDFVEDLETAERVECEVLDISTQSTKSRDHMSESGDEMHQEEMLKNSPDCEKDQIVEKEATDEEISGLEKNNSWASSLDNSITSQSDLACDESAEFTNYTNKSANNQLCGDLKHQSGVNGNSQVNIDLFKSNGTKEQEEMLSGVQKSVGRTVAEEGLIHSAESEFKAEACSFGE